MAQKITTQINPIFDNTYLRILMKFDGLILLIIMRIIHYTLPYIMRNRVESLVLVECPNHSDMTHIDTGKTPQESYISLLLDFSVVFNRWISLNVTVNSHEAL